MASILVANSGEADPVDVQRDRVLDSLKQEARNKASRLSNIVSEKTVQDTVDFITSTSAQLLDPTALRYTPASSTDDAMTRQGRQFTILIDRLIKAFEAEEAKEVEISRRELCRHLAKVDLALTTALTKLFMSWEKDKEKRAKENQNKYDEKERYRLEPRAFHERREKSAALRRKIESVNGTASSSTVPSTAAAQNDTNKASAPRIDKSLNTTLSQSEQLKILPERSKTTKDVSAGSSVRQESETPGTLQQQPGEADDFGLDTPDGVLVGRPPNYPAGLLDWEDENEDDGDWEDTEDFDDMQEIVARRRARAKSKASDQEARGSADRDEVKPEKDWVFM